MCNNLIIKKIKNKMALLTVIAKQIIKLDQAINLLLEVLYVQFFKHLSSAN